MLGRTIEECTPIAMMAEGVMAEVTNIFGQVGEIVDGGTQVFHVRIPSGNIGRVHYHHSSQFQIFFPEGNTSTFGRKVMTSPYVHYADANTPYGPFASGSESLDWVTLRIQSCKGRFYMPEFRDELAKLGRGGKSYHLPVDLRPVEPGRVEATLLLEREDGLAAHQVSLGDGAKFTLPLAGSSAQHVLVIRGEVVCGDRHFGPRACLEIRKEDGRVELQPTMGMSCEVLLLRYPEGELEPGREKFARSEETQTSNH